MDRLTTKMSSVQPPHTQTRGWSDMLTFAPQLISKFNFHTVRVRTVSLKETPLSYVGQNPGKQCNRSMQNIWIQA